MDEVKIHSGTRVKMKRLEDGAVTEEFLGRLRELAHKEEVVEAIYLFCLEAEGVGEQLSMAIAIKSGLFSKNDDEFLRLVDEIQLILPEDTDMNLYRLKSVPPIARYCLNELEPVYLRSTSWRDKAIKKLAK